MVETSRKISAGGETYLAFHEDGMYALEEMLLARYHMHRQVYGHKTRVGIDRMLVRSMRMGVDEGLVPVAVFKPPAQPDKAFVMEYLAWDDAAVTRTLCGAPDDSTPGRVMRALVDRRLCKRVHRFEHGWLQTEYGTLDSGFMLAPEPEVLRELLPDVEAAIGSVAGLDPCWVVLHWEDRENPLSLRYSLRTSAKKIIMTNDQGKTASFHDMSEVFTEGEPPSRASISLYIRPKNDKPMTSALAKKVRNAALAGLEQIAQAGAEV